MNSKVVIFAFVAVFCVLYVNTASIFEGKEEDVFGSTIMRQKRATCDLLSGLGVANSACAAHCLFTGHKGGYCDKGVCICRD